jgi:uncharacterized protein (DUF488 family)
VPLLTFGHGTASEEQIVELLRRTDVALVVDVRTAPGSRRHPHVARAALGEWLPAAGIGYRWEPRLGGFRTPAPDSPDVAWRDESFRGYAAWTRRPEFQAALTEVLEEAARRRTAVMCSESLWWRCHRRLIADAAVLLRHTPTEHLFHDGRLVVHQPHPAARVTDDHLLVYDGGTLPITT